MEMQNHIFDELTVIFSKERLDGYLSNPHTISSKNDALIAYSWNIELSQALYPALQILEITLRNSIHHASAEKFQTEQWFDLSFLHENEKARINKAKKAINDKGKAPTPGRIIAELSFGFWVSLFDIRYEHNQTLWPKLIKPIFPFLPKSQKTRDFLSRELNRIKFLRNRVFHYEPIWHWNDLPLQHESITRLVNCLSRSAAKYLIELDSFKEVHAKGKKR